MTKYGVVGTGYLALNWRDLCLRLKGRKSLRFTIR